MCMCTCSGGRRIVTPGLVSQLRCSGGDMDGSSPTEGNWLALYWREWLDTIHKTTASHIWLIVCSFFHAWSWSPSTIHVCTTVCPHHHHPSTKAISVFYFLFHIICLNMLAAIFIGEQTFSWRLNILLHNNHTPNPPAPCRLIRLPTWLLPPPPLPHPKGSLYPVLVNFLVSRSSFRYLNQCRV